MYIFRFLRENNKFSSLRLLYKPMMKKKNVFKVGGGAMYK